MGDGHPPVSGTGASAVKFLSIRSGRPARSAAGTVVVGLGAGCDTPSRPSRLHEPAHRPSGLVATPPAFQGFVDPSITVGLFGVVEEIRHKNSEFLYDALRDV